MGNTTTHTGFKCVLSIYSKAPVLPFTTILNRATEGVDFTPQKPVTLIMPTHTRPYYRAISLKEKSNGYKANSFYIDPYTGEKFDIAKNFKLSQFIYDLHIDLQLPAGDYIVGFITLFFFFVIISGVFIHARKLIGNFFNYRNKSNARSQFLDIHNIIGVMTLPFTVMYAITGLIFSLLIIYSIATGILVYQGGQAAANKDVGKINVELEWQGTQWVEPDIEFLYQQATQKYNNEPRAMVIYNYGDESAAIRFIINEKNSLIRLTEIVYRVDDNSVYQKLDREQDSPYLQGYRLVNNLHFGSFAGFDLRILYFILGLGVCSLIVTGNLLWIEKRTKQRNQSKRTLAFTKRFTVWLTGGVIFSIAVIFFIERILPMQINYIEFGFVATLMLVAIILCLKGNIVVKLGWLLILSGVIATVTVCSDWLLFSDEILVLWSQGVTSIIGTEIWLMLSAILCLSIGQRLTKKVNP